MQIINRKTAKGKGEIFEVKAVGFNSNGVLTISCAQIREDKENKVQDVDKDTEMLINFRGEDLQKIKKFIKEHT